MIYEDIRGLAITLLNQASLRGEVITEELIVDLLQVAAQTQTVIAGPSALAQVDLDALARDLESSVNVHVASGGIMDGDGAHVPWLEEARSSINWRFWERYKTYLSTVEHLPPAAIQRLDEITDMVLSRLENPLSPGVWDRRGLVAGQVQSGKTGNYTGLICKAIDSGYKLIVVLAGVHNSLRAQTQVRIDEGVLGFDTGRTLRFDGAHNGKVGVGLLSGPFLHVNSFTSRKQNGDFNTIAASQVGVTVGGSDPVVLVVKKNKSILTNLVQWATGIAGVIDPDSGEKTVRGVPLLIIDDEADQASIDTNGPRRGREPDDYSPTTINSLITKLLARFEQSGYVGYTATPFANIFIDPLVRHREGGVSLFPRDFIISLPAPSTYVGPSRVFGLNEDVARSIEQVNPLPMVRAVRDNDLWLDDLHDKSTIPGELPPSLIEAMMSFILVCAIRHWRGQSRRHNSMLVHVTRFTDVQRHIHDQVSAELDRLREHVKMGQESRDTIWVALQKLYRDDFMLTGQAFQRFDDLRDQCGLMPDWSDLKAHIVEVVDTIETRLVNGTSKDALEYVESPEGLNVIVIGGAKLSRGLTLEGLSVSYYLRASRMYDTLMQMGRWFGYRNGYLDLCRLYTTPELTRWYELITEASQELYQEFDYMVALGKTPREFGLRVQQHPGGLMVTSPSKMRQAYQVSLSFSGNLSETVLFKTDEVTRTRNRQAVKTLIESMSQSKTAISLTDWPGQGANYLWRNVPTDLITTFLESYTTHPDAYKVQPGALRDYIASRNHDSPPELIDWWVLVANSTNPSARSVSIAGRDVGLTKRQVHAGQQLDITHGRIPDRFPIRRLVSPPHERIDFRPGSESFLNALETTVKMWHESPRKRARETPPEAPSGIACRGLRPARTGVLIIYLLDPAEGPANVEGDTPYVGFAISFPQSHNAKPMSYQVTVDAWRQMVDAFSDTLSEEDDE